MSGIDVRWAGPENQEAWLGLRRVQGRDQASHASKCVISSAGGRTAILKSVPFV